MSKLSDEETKRIGRLQGELAVLHQYGRTYKLRLLGGQALEMLTLLKTRLGTPCGQGRPNTHAALTSKTETYLEWCQGVDPVNKWELVIVHPGGMRWTLLNAQHPMEVRGAHETEADPAGTCDRLWEIHKLATRSRVLPEDVEKIARLSEGFAPIPPCSICKQRHAEPEQNCPQLKS